MAEDGSSHRHGTAAASAVSSEDDSPAHPTNIAPTAVKSDADADAGAGEAGARLPRKEAQRLRRQRAKDQQAVMQAQLERMQLVKEDLALENAALAVEHQALAQMDVHQQELLDTLQRAHAGAALHSSCRVEVKDIRSVLCNLMEQLFHAGRNFEDSMLRCGTPRHALHCVRAPWTFFQLNLTVLPQERVCAPPHGRPVALGGRLSGPPGAKHGRVEGQGPRGAGGGGEQS